MPIRRIAEQARDRQGRHMSAFQMRGAKKEPYTTFRCKALFESYGSTRIVSVLERASAISASSSKSFSESSILCKFGRVTGCLGTKTVQQSS